MPRAPGTLAVAFPRATPRVLRGDIELAVAAIARSAAPRPVRVTRLLAALYATVAGQTATPAAIRALASGAREWLLQRAAALFWGETGWFEAPCAACGQPMDLPARLSAAPVKAAGPGFPVAVAETSLGPRRFEVPNGAHEEALARGSDAAPERRLIALCGLADNAAAEAALFTEADLAAIDGALDAAAPEVADRLSATCPACGSPTEARLDPLAFAFPGPGALLRDVHTIASAYGWGEAEVLSLPSERRRAYARMIAVEGGARGAGRGPGRGAAR
jgi:hypothetical protein